MTWEFEHWDNGKVYLHEERWKKYVEDLQNDGTHYNTRNRILIRLINPRKNLQDVPVPGDDDYKHKITYKEDWNLIYQPFPAFMRTDIDPEGWSPSWNLFADDNDHYAEKFQILNTGPIHKKHQSFMYIGESTAVNVFAFFRDEFWSVIYRKELGLGAYPEPPKQKKTKLQPRSVFDEFESSW